MKSTISKLAQNKVLETLRDRYQEAAKPKKTKILDEFLAVDGVIANMKSDHSPTSAPPHSKPQPLIDGPTMRQRLPSVSPATIARLLTTGRSTASHRKKQKTQTKPSKQVPIRTFADWNEPLHGRGSRNPTRPTASFRCGPSAPREGDI